MRHTCNFWSNSSVSSATNQTVKLCKLSFGTNRYLYNCVSYKNERSWETLIQFYVSENIVRNAKV